MPLTRSPWQGFSTIDVAAAEDMDVCIRPLIYELTHPCIALEWLNIASIAYHICEMVSVPPMLQSPPLSLPMRAIDPPGISQRLKCTCEDEECMKYRAAFDDRPTTTGMPTPP